MYVYTRTIEHGALLSDKLSLYIHLWSNLVWRIPVVSIDITSVVYQSSDNAFSDSHNMIER